MSSAQSAVVAQNDRDKLEASGAVRLLGALDLLIALGLLLRPAR